MSERRRGLGRGLGALIPSAPPEEAEGDASVHGPAPEIPGTATEASPGPQSAGQPADPARNAGSAGPVAGAGPNGAGSGLDTGGQDFRRIADESAPTTAQAGASPAATSVPSGREARRETERETGRKNERETGPEAEGGASSEPRPTAGTSGSGSSDAEEAGPGTHPASEAVSADEQGRSAGGGRGRSVSPAARQKAMKARMDMGEAFRGTSLGTRPSDMFFLPSAPANNGDSATVSTDSGADEAAKRSVDAPEPDASAVGVEDAGPDRARRARVASERPAERAGGDHVSRETAEDGDDLAAVPGATFAEVPVDAIHPNRKQPRQVFDEEELAELAYSIGELGVLQPIVVRPSRENGDAAYELVMGERRWRAAQRAGLAAIPAIVRETTDDSLLRDALLENLHRSQLNPLEEAAAYQQLMEEFGATQEELSRRIGRSRPQISNTIRLLRLPPLVQRRVAAGVLSSGHARALLSLSDPAEMERLAQRIVAEGLSVRATEEAVQLTEGGRRTPQRTAAPSGGRHEERLAYIADAFADRLDTSVKIALGARKGKMTIEFASVDDLNRIIEVLDPEMDSQ